MPRILIAEDEPHIAEALSFLLEREGYAVTLCTNGTQAHHNVPGHDLLVLDIMLPGMSGFEVAQAAKANGTGVKICVLSAKGQAADVKRMEDIGVDAFVTKPFSNRHLLETVRQLLQPA